MFRKTLALRIADIRIDIERHMIWFIGNIVENADEIREQFDIASAILKIVCVANSRVLCQATSLTETMTSQEQYHAPRSSELKRFPPARV